MIIFDDFVKDTAGVYRKLLEFLEVDPGFQTDFVVYNQHKDVHSQVINRLIMRPPHWVKVGTELWSRVVPGKVFRVSRRYTWKIQKANVRDAKRPSIKPDTRRQLLAEMQPELEKLGQLLDRDLSFWLNS